MIDLLFKYYTIKTHSSLLKLGGCIRFELLQFCVQFLQHEIVSLNLNLVFKKSLYHSMVNDCASEVISKMFGCFGVLLYSIGGTSNFFETTDVSAQRLWQEKKSKMSKLRSTRQGGEAWELFTGIGSGCCRFPFTEFFDSSCYQKIQFRFRIFLIAAAMNIPNTEF